MTAELIPRPVSEFQLERVDQDILLYHPGLTKTVHLNETASLIWQLCDGARSIEDIIAVLQDTFPDAATEIAADVETTLQRLADEGAVEFS